MLTSYDKKKRKKILDKYLKNDNSCILNLPAWVLANNRCQWRNPKIPQWKEVKNKDGTTKFVFEEDANQCNGPCYTTKGNHCPKYCFYHRQLRGKE